jgi:hypothetical protein
MVIRLLLPVLLLSERVAKHLARVPPNVRFEIDDFEADWTFGSDKFDFVFARLLLTSISNYPRLYKQAFE